MEGYLAGAIARWNTGVAGAHLCILRSGEVVLTCALSNVAYGAGTNNNPAGGTYGRTPFWRTHNINAYAVHVELEGFAATGYTPEQARACRRVSDWLAAKYSVVRQHTYDMFAGQHTHAELSTSRSDPGAGFSFGWVL